MRSIPRHIDYRGPFLLCRHITQVNVKKTDIGNEISRAKPVHMPRLVHFVIIEKRKKFGLGSVVVYLIEIGFLSKEMVFLPSPDLGQIFAKFFLEFPLLESFEKTWKSDKRSTGSLFETVWCSFLSLV